MPFLVEPEPPRGVALPVMPGIARVVAPNPGVMTYHGTNTYLIDTPDGCVVLDPGPNDAGHVRAILAAASGPIAHILLSHTHRDHLGAVAALRQVTGAPVHAYGRNGAPGFAPDLPLNDGDVVAGLTALRTPGHASDHLCFAAADGTLFSADHVMSWSSSVISPLDGDMAAYFASLRRLLARDDRLYLPGHGPPLPRAAQSGCRIAAPSRGARGGDRGGARAAPGRGRAACGGGLRQASPDFAAGPRAQPDRPSAQARTRGPCYLHGRGLARHCVKVSSDRLVERAQLRSLRRTRWR